jgi:hypothetical protein
MRMRSVRLRTHWGPGPSTHPLHRTLSVLQTVQCTGLKKNVLASPRILLLEKNRNASFAHGREKPKNCALKVIHSFFALWITWLGRVWFWCIWCLIVGICLFFILLISWVVG